MANVTPPPPGTAYNPYGGITGGRTLNTQTGANTPPPVPRTGQNGSPDYSAYGGYSGFLSSPEGQAWTRMQPASINRDIAPNDPTKVTGYRPPSALPQAMGATIYGNDGTGGGGVPGSVGGGGGVPPPVPGGGTDAAAAAMMSLAGSEEPPQMLQSTEGAMLRNLGRRIYPQESTALASMGRVY